jgi:hypothetical protein
VRAPAPETGTFRGVALHAVDGLALVHAVLLRIQALVLPFQSSRPWCLAGIEVEMSRSSGSCSRREITLRLNAYQ